MVNQKKRAMAVIMLLRRAKRSCSSRRPATRSTAVCLAEADQSFGEGGVGVHGNVPGDVVKDVGLGQVVEAGGFADGGGGELAVAKTVEE